MRKMSAFLCPQAIPAGIVKDKRALTCSACVARRGGQANGEILRKVLSPCSFLSLIPPLVWQTGAMDVLSPNPRHHDPRISITGAFESEQA